MSAGSRPDGTRTGRAPVRAARGVVSTSHYLATATGVEALRRGGSAVDAIIAAGAVLCVVYPHMAGLGGDGFWAIATADGDVRALNASGPAASGATIDRYREWGEAIPSRGARAALTVPGAIDGWREAHDRHGKLPWRDLFADAIVHARHGAAFASSPARSAAAETEALAGDEAAAALFLRDGRPLREGERLVQADLARSLREIAERGARTAFYEGSLGERFCAAVARGGSPLRPDDLARFRAEWVEPVSTTYRGRTVVELPPNTQGLAALQILNLVEGWDVEAWGDGSVDYYHHLAEAVKVAFADRDEWLTDPAFVNIPLDRLLAKDYAGARRELISRDTSLDLRAVAPGLAFTGAARRTPGGDTCYLCAWDEDGLVVSAIQSVYHAWGAGIVAGDTGIIPQNRGSFFSLDEAHPNRLEPGKRTFHTLIPALMLRDGRPEAAFGSMGGEGQPQTHAALVTRLVDFGYDVQRAIEAPRWRVGRTWGTAPDDLALEGRVPEAVVQGLRRRGQRVRRVLDWDESMGHAQAIRLDERGFLEGGADPRGDGLAIGY